MNVKVNQSDEQISDLATFLVGTILGFCSSQKHEEEFQEWLAKRDVEEKDSRAV
jgi:hypothetical protein